MSSFKAGVAAWFVEAGAILAGAGGVWRRRVRLIGGLIAVCGVAAWLVAASGADRAGLDRITSHPDEATRQLARTLSRWGEMHLGPLIAVVLLAASGWALRKAAWKRAASCGLLGLVTAGLAALLLKIAFGRPRPCLHAEDWMRGISLHWNFHSFPSGHAAHCWGLVMAVGMVAPRWGLALAGPAVAVCWSRLYLEQHFPTDIAAGALLGAIIGVTIGVAGRSRPGTVEAMLTP